MRVTLLNKWDTGGGAARAATRLLEGLRRLGVDARLLVENKKGDQRCVCGPGSEFREFLGLLRLRADDLAAKVYRNRRGPFSPALLPDSLAGRVRRTDPDLVHLHWMGSGFLRIETLRRLARPLVWTLHDSWAFTGGCHVPGVCRRYREACGRCPVLGSKCERDLSRWVFRRKRRSWEGLPITFVAPSRWLAECAEASSLLREYRVEVIPNGLDTSVFAPLDPAFAKAALGVPPGAGVILFGGVGATTDPNKGFDLLCTALRALSPRPRGAALECLVFGAAAPSVPVDVGIPMRYLGRLTDDVTLRLAYCAADVVVVPSRSEAFGQTASEAAACGTPVVAFGATGLTDVVEHRRTGYLAAPHEASDLAAGVEWVLADHARRAELGRRARQKAEGEFALERVASRYLALYRELQGAA